MRTEISRGIRSVPEGATAGPAGKSTSTEFVLHALDGLPLAATLFEPAAARGTVILHGATAVPQRFYRAFAAFLADSGVRVVTYDYRGVGRSRPASLRGYRATLDDWARLDARGVHRYVREHFAGPVAIVGHSFGGQLVGLIDEPREVAGALFVATQLAYYGDWPRLARPRLLFFWRVAFPLLTSVFGYLPARAGLGEDLPTGVALQWARWCLHPDYFVSEHPDAVARLAHFDPPLAFYTFTDDPIAPPGTVAALLARLPAAHLEHRRVEPKALGLGPVDHVGFFRARNRDPLWSEALAFLDDVFAGRAPRLADRPVRRPVRPPASIASIASWVTRAGTASRARASAASAARASAAFDWDLTEEELLADLRGCRD